MENIIIKLDSGKLIDEEKYNKAGIWALWGINKETGVYNCLEVGQTKNILKEINTDIEILNLEDSKECKNCSNTYPARMRNKSFSRKFDVHNCCCDCKERSKGLKREHYIGRNPRHIDKYKDMLLHFKDLKFVLVGFSENQEERKSIERRYAYDNKALYWYS